MPESKLYWACFCQGSGRIFEDSGLCIIAAKKMGTDSKIKSFGSRLAAESWLEQMGKKKPGDETKNALLDL